MEDVESLHVRVMEANFVLTDSIRFVVSGASTWDALHTFAFQFLHYTCHRSISNI